MSLAESHDSVEYVSEVQDILSEEEGEIKNGEEEHVGGAWRQLMDEDSEEDTKKSKKMDVDKHRSDDDQNGTSRYVILEAYTRRTLTFLQWGLHTKK